jgi:hypothetical protein
VRASWIEGLQNIVPPVSRASQFQKFPNAAIRRAMEHQHVQPRRVHTVLSSFQQVSFNECFQRFGNRLHIVSHERRELFAGHEGARVPMQKQEQVEVAGVAYSGDLRKQTLKLVPVGARWI